MVSGKFLLPGNVKHADDSPRGPSLVAGVEPARRIKAALAAVQRRELRNDSPVADFPKTVLWSLIRHSPS